MFDESKPTLNQTGNTARGLFLRGLRGGEDGCTRLYDPIGKASKDVVQSANCQGERAFRLAPSVQHVAHDCWLQGGCPT